MELLAHILSVGWSTIGDILPILAIILFFQYAIIKKPISNPKRLVAGFLYVLVGLTLFLVGLQEALFPIGKLMAVQLTDPVFVHGEAASASNPILWYEYVWVYIFAAAIGFATTIAEPSLLAVAIKAKEVSGGVIKVWGLRIAVAIGVAVGITLGSYRIVTGTPLHYYIVVGYIIVIIQTAYAPRLIIGLAYDSGGVTTSTVTVPLVAALGLGLAGTVPGRSVLIDGFGLIAFASLCPIMSVMAYAQISQWRSTKKLSEEKTG